MTNRLQPLYFTQELIEGASCPALTKSVSGLPIKGIAIETDMKMDEKRMADLFRVSGGPMSEGETKFLRGVQDFIDFAIRNGLSFHAAMAYLSHDWNEFAHYGFDFETPIKKGFLPKVYAFSEMTGDEVGEPEESAETR